MTVGLDLADGLELFSGYLDREMQENLLEIVREIVAAAPLFVPGMPRTGKPMTVRMTNCGPLGWVTDREKGYRYQPMHPKTGEPWPPIPKILLDIWNELAGYPKPPEACLVNFYSPDARMGLHQDRDERNFEAPVVSISLGDTCLFRLGGTERPTPTKSVRLESGDVLVIGGRSRLCYHGVDRIYPGTSMLLKQPGRVNLTLRRVNT
ncbi:alpha-ketoglutarate-dependent dioxygenase AlkB [Pseudomonas sp. R2.Fl]|nr:alpha-ketoglutarate-dependent dioxygenase AlkB [Pseudomonas sp. R2.Fl]